MVHAAVAAVFCLLFVAIGLPWPCLLWPAAFYFGREVAQAEYRYIEAHGGKRANCPWWCGFKPGAWNAKSLLDWLLPLGAATATWLVTAVYL